MPTRPRLTVHVDPNLCEGHGLCLQTAPNLFELNDEEIAVCAEHPAIHSLKDLTAAAAACPRQAITVEHETTEPVKDIS